MKKRLYFAYGSNCNLGQMARRCPAAKKVGPVTLDGYRLTFNGKRSGTGVANVLKNPGSVVHGLLWEITPACERSLDRYEGFPSFYYKKDLEVETFPLEGGEPETLTAMVYIMTEGHRLGAPSDYYYKVLEDGYKAFHFPMHILEQALSDSIGRGEAIRRLGKCSLTRPKRKEQNDAVSEQN